MVNTKTYVLFLCTGNSCRSQMAEGVLRHLAGDRFEVFSAGLEPSEVNPLAIQVMAEIGIDISGQRSKHVDEVMGQREFHYVVSVCDKAAKACPVVFMGLAERQYWPFDDPAEARGSADERLAKFRSVRDQIRDRIETWLAEV